jgi:hypothetical protein
MSNQKLKQLKQTAPVQPKQEQGQKIEIPLSFDAQYRELNDYIGIMVKQYNTAVNILKEQAQKIQELQAQIKDMQAPKEAEKGK